MDKRLSHSREQTELDRIGANALKKVPQRRDGDGSMGTATGVMQQSRALGTGRPAPWGDGAKDGFPRAAGSLGRGRLRLLSTLGGKSLGWQGPAGGGREAGQLWIRNLGKTGGAW